MSKPPFLRAVAGDGPDVPAGTPPTSPFADQIRAIAEKAIAQGAMVFCAVWETSAETHVDSAPQSEFVEIGAMVALRNQIQEKYGSSAGEP